MEGRATESLQGGSPRKIRPGGAFGEVALMNKTERNATVSTDQICSLWVLD